ncbi:MAG TPA: hypothetical protein VD994_05430, partial [Prosthecobacter sp.]|nr:hypothetical protein [Prosthecobacter sp.]
MDWTDASVEELKKILEQDFSAHFTTEHARDATRRLMTFYEGYVKWLSAPPATPPGAPQLLSEQSTAQDV